MRLYYIFNIKKDIYKITKDDPESLYKLLESIKYLNKEEVNIGYKTFNKVCELIDKKRVHKLIKDEFIEDTSYTIFLNNHIINDFLNNESSKLTICNAFIKLKSNSIYPSFFKCLKTNKYYFVCDFNNMDYFYLNSVVSKVYTR